MIKKSNSERLFDGLNVIGMILLMAVTLYPFMHVVFASLSEPSRLVKHTGLLLYPLGFTLEGYKLVLSDPNVLTGYKNTLMYVVLGTGVNLVMTSIAAFTLSRRNFPINKIIFKFIVFTMFFGGGLIPNYLVVSTLGLRNSIFAIILPGAISTWNLIIMRNSFLSIPESFEESAYMDGAGDLTVLLKIILPLSKAMLAVMTLFYGIGHWNSWFSAAIYLSDKSKYPLQLFLREILIINNTQELTADVSEMDRLGIDKIIQYATIMVATLPILLLYPFLQKHFTKGVLVGGIKG